MCSQIDEISEVMHLEHRGGENRDFADFGNFWQITARRSSFPLALPHSQRPHEVTLACNVLRKDPTCGSHGHWGTNMSRVEGGGHAWSITM